MLARRTPIVVTVDADRKLSEGSSLSEYSGTSESVSSGGKESRLIERREASEASPSSSTSSLETEQSGSQAPKTEGEKAEEDKTSKGGGWQLKGRSTPSEGASPVRA